MIEFKNKEELFERVRPVLSLRVRKLKLLGFDISEVEIFNMLSKDFSNIKGLTLFDVVDLIMNFEIF